jgi:hypothetical protein
MKKIYCAFLGLLFSANVFAGGDDTKSLLGISKRDKGMVSKGFYLHVGLGFNSYRVPQNILTDDFGTSTKTLVLPAHNHSVFQPSLEIGNQFMFYRGNDEKWGIGMNFSWLTLGYGSYNATVPLVKNDPITDEEEVVKVDTKIADFQIGILRLGPMFSYGIGDDLAVDAFFNVNPHLRVGAGLDESDASYLLTGVNFVPGVKLRYKVFAVGFETQFGRMNYISSASSYDLEAAKVTSFTPRILLGFKF